MIPRWPRLKNQRGPRIAFLLLLGVCVAQAAYWIVDQAMYTGGVRAAALQEVERDRAAAQRLLACGATPKEVVEHFPRLLVSDSGRVELAPAALDELDEQRARRMRQYGAEGSFFLIVLVGSMVVLTRALRQDAQLRERQQEFLASASHEFKSPLASARLSLETLALRDPPAERRGQLLTRALSDLTRMEGLVVNLLDTAQLEQGAVRLVAQRLQLAPTVAAALEELAERARSVGAQIETQVAPELEIEADPVAVRAVLRNLVDNALKSIASAKGGWIRLSARRRGALVELEVEDGGRGFDPELSDRLFEKFFRGKHNGTQNERLAHGGAGLGLYLVRRFVELEGGSVRAHSKGHGQGASFTVAWRAAANTSTEPKA